MRSGKPNGRKMPAAHKPLPAGQNELKQREWYVEVDLSKYISYVIDTLNHDTSVSKLLDPKDRINNLLIKKGFRTAEEVK